MQQLYPILEYDPDREAILEPAKLVAPNPEMPEHGVITFFQDVLDDLVSQGIVREIASVGSEMGVHPIYVYEEQGRPVALFHPGIGSPLAAAILEGALALGCRKLVVCGGAGVLDREIATGHLVVPTAAVRDEGTSYHYLPPAREVEPSAAGVAAIQAVLRAEGVPYLHAKTWTTDAIFRETRERMARRRAEGCLTVEMEAAALFAVAKFRGVHLAQILYGGDNLDADEWENRGWVERSDVRNRLIQLAARASLAIDDHIEQA